MAPREVDGCAINLGNEPGLHEVRNFGVWHLGPQLAERGVFGHKKGAACSTKETVTNLAEPMAPAVPRAPWASPAAISVAG